MVPSEGVTGWADMWMMSTHAKHPNCMYMWMAWALKPATQVQSAEWFGEAPANPLACPVLDKGFADAGLKNFCTIYHATDTAFYNAVAFWKTPSANCGDSRGQTCVDYSKWVDAYMVVAAIVTVADAVIAFPIAYFMARVASPRTRAALAVAVLLPLWASYLVCVYAWRVILSDSGLVDWVFAQLGVPNVGSLFGISDLSMTIVFVYLWLPYMILPIFAGLERIPASYLEASADLGGHPWTTFRRIILPLAIPALAAGSIFTFSLTLGDYITPQLVSNSQFIGNVIYDELGVAGDIPFAAAFAMVPILIIAIYLLMVRRLGAFEAL